MTRFPAYADFNVRTLVALNADRRRAGLASVPTDAELDAAVIPIFGARSVGDHIAAVVAREQTPGRRVASSIPDRTPGQGSRRLD
jgi:hypothetical protein